MPSGGDGFYYFSTYLLLAENEYGYFDIQNNGNVLCTARTDQDETSAAVGQAACSAAIYGIEGTVTL